MDALKVYCDGHDYVIATDPVDATRVWEGYIGEPRADFRPGATWTALDPNADLKIEVEIHLSGRAYAKETRSMAARGWCVVFGRGFLCSTES